MKDDEQWSRFNDADFKVYHDQNDRPNEWIVVGPSGRIVKVTSTARSARRALRQAMTEPPRTKTWELPEVDLLDKPKRNRQGWGLRHDLAAVR